MGVIVLIGFTALLHAGFQLAISVLTLLSGHALGRKQSHLRLLHLAGSFIWGAVVAVVALLFTALYVLSVMPFHDIFLWAVITGIGVGSGIVVLLFYWRPSDGSRLWLPKAFADYLYDRTRKTRSGAEAFGLGIISIVSELPFTLAPLLITAMLLRGAPDLINFFVIAGYAVVATLPLILIFLLLGSGLKVSRIQKWRENNRRFAQITSGLGLMIISLYLFVVACLARIEVPTL